MDLCNYASVLLYYSAIYTLLIYWLDDLEMHTRTENSINESLNTMKQEYETKILERDTQMKECLQKHEAVSYNNMIF